MGRAIALAFAKEGGALVCYDLKAKANPHGYKEDLPSINIDRIIKNGDHAIFQAVDISNFE